jgi:hypothetical protein
VVLLNSRSSGSSSSSSISSSNSNTNDTLSSSGTIRTIVDKAMDYFQSILAGQMADRFHVDEDSDDDDLAISSKRKRKRKSPANKRKGVGTANKRKSVLIPSLSGHKTEADSLLKSNMLHH